MGVIRRRNVPFTKPGYYVNYYPGTETEASRGVYPPYYGLQTTESEENDIRLLRNNSGLISGDIGSPFYTEKEEYFTDGPVLKNSRWRGSLISSGLEGPISATNREYTLSWRDMRRKWAPSSSSQIDAFGTTAISRVLPTSPSADLSVFIGELLREGVPKAVGAAALKNRFRDYRDIGGEYLNVQFGWLPIVSEIQQISRAIATQEQRIAQLTRDSGRLVRRRFDFPTEITTDGPVAAGGHYPYPNPNSEGRRRYYGFLSSSDFHQRKINRWFSGAFSFHFALGNTQQSRMRDQATKARVLLGLDLTPAVLWNLSPWSWLADWVSNTGDILANASAFSKDNLVLQYGYMMEHHEHSYIHTGFGLDYLDQDRWRHAKIVTDQRLITTKQRRRATPYGFGLDTSGFTAKQWSILGALSMTKGPNLLR